MMRYLKVWALVLLALVMAACGGGGNPGGTPSTGGGTGGTTGPSMTLDVLSGAGVNANAISTVEVAVAKVTLKDASSAPIKGVIVTFSGGALLTVSPISATALTDANGQATVEIRAATTSSQGATAISASAAVSSTVTVTAQKAIAITSAPTTGVANPQDLANALNFLDTNPADKSIVLAGSGGSGRSESATLRFRVVDKNNSPVKGALVDFSVIPPSAVTLNISSATSDSDGVVVTTVSSKNIATAVVVKAIVNGKSITSQSDQLLVTTGVATAAGFDLSASKFNLNSALSGDSSTITVRIVDTNGNPVADGVPVVFTTDSGSVGSSSKGGCVTADGTCTVIYRVQDPRPIDGQPITVVASTQVGTGTPISKEIQLSAVDPSWIRLFSAADASGVEITELNLAGAAPVNGVCAKTFNYFVGTPGVLAAPSGTVVSMTGSVTGLTASITTGGTILDSRPSTIRSPLIFSVTASAASTDSPPCVANGPTINTYELLVKFTVGTISSTRPIVVKYRSL